MAEIAQFVAFEDLRDRYDVRTIAQLASDTGQSILIPELDTNTKIQAALSAGEGAILMAFRKGGRYSLSDLQSLTGSDLSYLKELITNLAMINLLKRRPKVDPKLFEYLQEFNKTHIEPIQNGDAIFATEDLDASLEAARPSLCGVDYQDLKCMNLVTVRKPRYFTEPILPKGRR